MTAWGLLIKRSTKAGICGCTLGRVTPVAAFLKDCAARLEGVRVLVAGADRFRQAEALQAIEDAGLNWPLEWRGTGASATAGGSFDVRSFQRAVLQGKLHVTRGAAVLTQAIMGSALRFDQAGNPALDKQKGLARIDPLQAAVIACGLGELAEGQAKPSPSRLVVVG